MYITPCTLRSLTCADEQNMPFWLKLCYLQGTMVEPFHDVYSRLITLRALLFSGRPHIRQGDERADDLTSDDLPSASSRGQFHSDRPTLLSFLELQRCFGAAELHLASCSMVNFSVMETQQHGTVTWRQTNGAMDSCKSRTMTARMLSGLPILAVFGSSHSSHLAESLILPQKHAV
ncbi:hypothetical protein NEOLEDRAFT_846131 [Neolentinus lepideus HHB14362 ss-1]|uniref:Uncharacterized protein n=1 Tax=Neolentinus lepideus HHB14362 ss-1 TaxID=1314782 RepID=A0A165UNF9_9AGAM|nr:hypothetical protein NEOLEDRAFT_846131 [Neolentinus lepideus HHB14362 ss-1]